MATIENIPETTTPPSPPEAAATPEKRKPSIFRRFSAVVVMIVGFLGLLVCVAAIVGVLALWGPVRDAVNAVSNTAAKLW